MPSVITLSHRLRNLWNTHRDGALSGVPKPDIEEAVFDVAIAIMALESRLGRRLSRADLVKLCVLAGKPVSGLREDLAARVGVKL